MGRISARFQTETMTVWPVTESDNGYGTPVYGTPYTLKCEYSQQQKSVVDDSGVQFIPSWTFHVSTEVPRGSIVILGDYAAEATPVDGANPVRTVRVIQNLQRMGGPDVTVYCG